MRVGYVSRWNQPALDAKRLGGATAACEKDGTWLRQPAAAPARGQEYSVYGNSPRWALAQQQGQGTRACTAGGTDLAGTSGGGGKWLLPPSCPPSPFAPASHLPP